MIAVDARLITVDVMISSVQSVVDVKNMMPVLVKNK